MDKFRNFIVAAQAIDTEIKQKFGPPEEGAWAVGQPVILRSLVRGTRGYIEKIANQANGCYERGWYDGCAVMLRRLLETLIIEVFEHHKIATKIQNSNGDFFFLRDLISEFLKESSWNLSRNAKQSLPRLKDMGDKSAHSRRYIAQRADIDALVADLRMVTQELISLAGLK
ncbi:hypothetical protein [Rhizobium sp.]